MNIKCRLEITLGTCGGTDEFRIALHDEDAGVRFAQVTLTPAQYALVMTARSISGLSCDVRGIERAGTQAENKTELVPYSLYHEGRDDAAIAAALAPFEVDGWRARQGDMTNGHCRVSKRDVHYQRVVFFRNVPKVDHALAGGDACTFVEGLCSSCGVGEGVCEECTGNGYHREGCSEIEA